MSVLFVALPIAIVLGGSAVLAFIWAPDKVNLTILTLPNGEFLWMKRKKG